MQISVLGKIHDYTFDSLWIILSLVESRSSQFFCTQGDPEALFTK